MTSPHPDEIVQRLEALEIKASFTEDLLDQLNLTIYQQQQLIDRLTQEVIQLRQQVPEGGPAIERIAQAILGTVRQLRHNELFVRIVELDPELILPYLFSRRGRSQDLFLELTADAIAQGQRATEVRRGHPVAMARALVLAAHGFVLSSHTMVDERATEQEIQLEHQRRLREAAASDPARIGKVTWFGGLKATARFLSDALHDLIEQRRMTEASS